MGNQLATLDAAWLLFFHVSSDSGPPSPRAGCFQAGHPRARQRGREHNDLSSLENPSVTDCHLAAHGSEDSGIGKIYSILSKLLFPIDFYTGMVYTSTLLSG